jgi:hypothetical protein
LRAHHPARTLVTGLQRPLGLFGPGPGTLRGRLRIIGSALVLTCLFSASTVSSPGDGLDLLRVSLKSGADRLVELQLPDGGWPRSLGGESETAITGRPARALLAAHAVLGDPAHLAAADRAADHLLARLGRDPRAARPVNLLFLAELGRAADRADCLAAARRAFERDLVERGRPDGGAAAHELLARPNPTKWSDEGWRNYLMWSAGDLAALSRAVGHERWSDAFVVGLAATRVPKHDHGWYAMGAGRTLASLSAVPGPAARRLAQVQAGLLRNNEVLPGIPWNETPYDSFAYTLETAAVLGGLLVAPDGESRLAAQDGLLWLARQQSPTGGWGATFSLFAGGLTAGAGDWVPEAELAVDETPELDAEVVLALAGGLRTAPLRVRPKA